MASKFISDWRQRVRLDGKVGASDDVVLGAPQASVLRPLLFILSIFELFYIVEDHIVGCACDIMIYVVIPIDGFWVLKWWNR